MANQKRQSIFNPEKYSGWFWVGDNIAVMSELDDGIVNMIYLDPPYNFKPEWNEIFKTANKRHKLEYKNLWKPTEFDDIELDLIEITDPKLVNYINAIGQIEGRKMKSYLIFMGIRLIEMKRILNAERWSIYLHCDSFASHFLKVLMDAIFGKANFQS